MLRLIFVVIALAVGAAQSLRGPFYALLFYLWFAYFRPDAWLWGYQLYGLNVSLIIGLMVVGMSVLWRKLPPLTLGLLVMLLFLAHTTVSTMLALHPEASNEAWFSFAKVMLISVLILALVDSPEKLRTVLLVIIFSLGFEGVKQGWAFLVFHIDEPNANSFEVLGDNNGVAVGMLMIAAVLLAMIQTSKKTWQKGMYGFMLLGVIFRAITTYSRGGLLSLAAMSIVYWVRSKYRIRTALLVACTATMLLSLMPPAYWDRMNTINVTYGEDRDASAAGRLYFWGVGRHMANDYPIFGVGTGGFEAAYDDYDTSGGGFGPHRAVHSTWFGILAEQGYVGLALFVLVLIVAFLAAGRARALSRNKDDLLFALSSALQTALVTVAVGGSFLSYHYVEILWHFVALSIAAGRMATVEHRAQAPVPQPVAAYGVGSL